MINRIILEPTVGQENGVISIYSMFASHVTPKTPYNYLWPQIMACSGGEGVDAMGLDFDNFWNKDLFDIEDSPTGLMRGIEFKAFLNPTDAKL